MTTALRTGEVDLAKTAEEANADAEAVSANILAGLTAKQKSTDELNSLCCVSSGDAGFHWRREPIKRPGGGYALPGLHATG